jgi:hypothetical protein
VSKKIQVTVTVKVDVDMEEWSQMYGVEAKDAAIRADVKAYVGNGVRDQLEASGFQETKVRYWV